MFNYKPQYEVVQDFLLSRDVNDYLEEFVVCDAPLRGVRGTIIFAPKTVREEDEDATENQVKWEKASNANN